MEENKRHVQVPNDMTKTNVISPKDLLIYTAIKRYANKEGISYPSLKRISEDSGAAINTVRKSISILEREGYIEIDKSKKGNIYHCIKCDNFEPFSYEFLDRKDLSFTDKAYYIASQQYMIKDNNVGKISFTNKELSKVINMPESTISKCNRSLQSKGYLTILDTKMKDLETGILKKEKVFDLEKLGQSIVFILKAHHEQIKQNTADIADIKESSKAIINENISLKKDIEILKTNYNKLYEELHKVKVNLTLD